MKLFFSLLILSISYTSLHAEWHNWIAPSTATASLVAGFYYCLEAEEFTKNNDEHAALESSVKGLALFLIPFGYFRNFLFNNTHDIFEEDK